jgi:hypothetical protein
MALKAPKRVRKSAPTQNKQLDSPTEGIADQPPGRALLRLLEQRVWPIELRDAQQHIRRLNQHLEHIDQIDLERQKVKSLYEAWDRCVHQVSYFRYPFHGAVSLRDAVSVYSGSIHVLSAIQRLTKGLLGDQAVEDLAKGLGRKSIAKFLVDPTMAASYAHSHAMLEINKKIITLKGVRYIPISLVAWIAQTTSQSIRRWIEKGVKFEGHALQTYTSPATKEFYLSEQSVQGMVNRFIKWPSRKPAGQVTIGESDDQTGFLAVPDAARIVGISRITLWFWANKGMAPFLEKPLDIIKCPISDLLYVRQSDVIELSNLGRRGAFKRGRKLHSLPLGTPKP